jgi:hypothetical protein
VLWPLKHRSFFESSLTSSEVSIFEMAGTKGSLQHAVSTFCRMRFQYWIWKFLIKLQCIAVRFYLGYWKQPWFGPAGSENACIYRMCKPRVTTKLKELDCIKTLMSSQCRRMSALFAIYLTVQKYLHLFLCFIN